MRVLTVCNQKGGVGKTTIALLLADTAARGGARVLFVDLDPQSNATSVLLHNAAPSVATLADVLVAPRPGNALAPLIRRASWGLDVAPASVGLVSKERNRRTADEHDLRRLMAPLDETYDLVVVDSPPNLGVLTVNALTAADDYLVVTDPSRFALDGIAACRETAEVVRTYFNPELEPAGVAVNLLDRTLETERRMDELCDWSDPVVLTSAVPRRVVVKESFAAGVSLWTVRGHRGADDVCAAAEGLYEEAVVQRAR